MQVCLSPEALEFFILFYLFIQQVYLLLQRCEAHSTYCAHSLCSEFDIEQCMALELKQTLIQVYDHGHYSINL